MPLSTGTRLGPYETPGPIGGGGMGGVYRPRDPDRMARPKRCRKRDERGQPQGLADINGLRNQRRHHLLYRGLCVVELDGRLEALK